MRFSAGQRLRLRWVVVVLAACSLAVTACSPGSLGSSEGEEGDVTLTLLVGNVEANVKPTQQLAADFHAANPDITINVEIGPAGTEGDNLVKTRLATGEMNDLFVYNSGSLFQAINPQRNLAPITGEAFLGNVEDAFKPNVTAGSDVYGVPLGPALGGGVLYNRPVYDRLGLHIPKTWSEFMANNAKVKAAGITPVIQTYQDTWTSQLFVLADFHNVAAAEPDFTQRYTNNQAKYATSPAAVKGFERLQEVHDAGYLNKDFASAKLDDGLRMVGTGKGAHYPMLTALVGQMVANVPEAAKDVGFFAQPGDDPAKNGMTTWYPLGRVHRQDRHRCQARRGQEVPGVHRQHRGLRLADQGDHAHRPLPGQGLHPPERPAAGGQGPDQVHPDAWRVQPGAGVPLPHQGPQPGEHHRRGGLGHPPGQGRRDRLRRGREEAGAAARSARLVVVAAPARTGHARP
jgi:raffinose/stachyose/melibiose transport system substrate-binding protein